MADGTNLAGYLLAGGEADQPVLVSPTDGVATRADLRAATDRLARAFRDDDLVGRRVGLDIGPGLGSIASYLALLATGNTVVLARRIEQPPWPSYLAAAELAAIVQAGDRDRTAVVRRGRDETAIPFGPPAGGDPADPGLDPAVVCAEPRRPAVNLFTSGTTGRPKMVELSHAALRHSSEAILERVPLGPGTRTALVLSLAHSFGLSVLHTHLRTSASLYCVERAEFPGDVLRAFVEGGANAMAGVPTQLRSLLASMRRDPGRRLDIDLVLQAGGRLEPDDAEALVAALPPHARLFQMYGQTEAAARIAILPADAYEKAPTSVGRPIQGLAVRIVDEAGDEVEVGTEGEIVVTGPTLMDGYYGDPGATAEALRDGWLHTGDIGHVDEDGFLYISGRHSTFVKLDGERVSLEAVEHAVLAAHPDELTDALARPVRTERGWAIALDVVLSDAGAAAEDLRPLFRQLKEAVRLAVGKKAVPASIAPTTSVPYTDNGKKSRPNIVY
jgi:acyl-CoA synthetase (AMP-forming)/AMP-acid ligase II